MILWNNEAGAKEEDEENQKEKEANDEDPENSSNESQELPSDEEGSHKLNKIVERYTKDVVFDYYDHLFFRLVPTIISLNKVMPFYSEDIFI